MKTIELTGSDGAPVAVNLDRVAYIQISDGNSLIVFSRGFSVLVRESYDVILETLNPERQAGC